MIAEARLGIPYEELEKTVCIFRAESALAAPFVRIHGVLLYPDPVEQAAICAWRLIRSGPFPIGNRLIGYEAMREMLILSGCHWSSPMEEAEDAGVSLERLERREVGLPEFVAWVRSRVTV